jgi:hypothetical protein
LHHRLLLPALAGLLAIAGCSTVEPLAVAVPAGAQARVELDRTPFFPQEDHQCGPAALATVMTAAGAPAAPDDLVAGVFLPGRAGSLQLDLLGATRRRGLLPYVLPGMPGAMLAEVAAGRPVLALQNLGVDSAPIWHYAVIVGYDAARNDIVLRSGSRRRLLMSWPRFLRSWERGGRWSVVVLQPGELPASAEPAAYLEACAGLEAAGMPDAAAAAYAAAAARWPENALVQLGLGNAAYARGDLLTAVAAYARGASLAPTSAPLHNNLAQALLDAGCHQHAAGHARRALRLAAGGSFEAAARDTLDQAERALAEGEEPASCQALAAAALVP